MHCSVLCRRNVNEAIKSRLKAVFQLRAFYTYVHARKSLKCNIKILKCNITFEVNKCFDGENSAFCMILHALVILLVKYKLVRRG